jgi:hypothetical protein
MREGYTAENYFDLISLTVSDMMIEGKSERNDEVDTQVLRFAFILREALGLPQPDSH